MRPFPNRATVHWLIRGETGCGVKFTARQFETRTTRDEREVNCSECRQRIAREKSAAKHGGAK